MVTKQGEGVYIHGAEEFFKSILFLKLYTQYLFE